MKAEGILSNLFHEAFITLITKIRNDITKKENYRLIPLMTIDANNLRKILTSQIQQYIK